MLLKKNISAIQLCGYIVANLIGLSVILSGIMFYFDSRDSGEESDSFISDDYIVVSKKVNGIGFSSPTFSEIEIEDIKSQKWAKEVGKFTSSAFPVNASVMMGGKGMSTYMFFESVPDDFFDLKPDGWDFDPSKRFIPIILNKDYLSLYNFGFAMPQGLPQVSEEIISGVPISISVTGPFGEQERFDARIVGFSSRLNTIAVPQSFMDWANNQFAGAVNYEPSRLIIKADRLNGGDMSKYMDNHDLEIAGDKKDEGKLSGFFSIVSAVVAGNGLLISVLAVSILILSIFLLLQKNQEILRNLMLLGYSPEFISSFYIRFALGINGIIVILSTCLSIFARSLWYNSMEALGLANGNIYIIVVTAIIFFIIISFINIVLIRQKIYSIWKS